MPPEFLSVTERRTASANNSAGNRDQRYDKHFTAEMFECKNLRYFFRRWTALVGIGRGPLLILGFGPSVALRTILTLPEPDSGDQAALWIPLTYR
jgi:hypothetical protein